MYDKPDGKLRSWLKVSCAALASLLVSIAAHSDLQPEDGYTEVLPKTMPAHWFWVVDGGQSQIDSRLMLFDGETGQMKGHVSTGYWTPGVALSADGSRILSSETYFSRGARGTREDVLAIYNLETLLPRAEIPVPPRRMTALTMQHMIGLSGDERILAITNFTPMRSVSLVDLATGVLLSEEETPGCGQIYPAGQNRIMTLCGDGSMLTFTVSPTEATLKEDGTNTAQPPSITRQQSERFFDPVEDPVIIPSARRGDTYFFTSFSGMIHELDASTHQPVLAKSWSLLNDKDKKKEWRTSGYQSLALHEASGLLYSLMHRGGEETYEEPGEEIWIFDSTSGERLRRIKLENIGTMVAVSSDDKPLLYVAGYQSMLPTWMLYLLGATRGIADLIKFFEPVVDVYDARTGKHIRTITGTGNFPAGLFAH
jgi:methylamine dehydrogenase heavy chain